MVMGQVLVAGLLVSMASLFAQGLDTQSRAPPIPGDLPPLCTATPPGVTCYELLVTGKIFNGDSVDVLEIGSGGSICGPAVVRMSSEVELLRLAPGVCIPGK
jgi:hypothetical protein